MWSSSVTIRLINTKCQHRSVKTLPCCMTPSSLFPPHQSPAYSILLSLEVSKSITASAMAKHLSRCSFPLHQLCPASPCLSCRRALGGGHTTQHMLVEAGRGITSSQRAHQAVPHPLGSKRWIRLPVRLIYVEHFNIHNDNPGQGLALLIKLLINHWSWELIYRAKEGDWVAVHGQGCPTHSTPVSHQTSEQNLSSTRSSRILTVCVVLQRGMFQQTLLYGSIIYYRTLVLSGQCLFSGVGATLMRMWKSLSSTSLCSAGSCHRPQSGMQGCEEGE